MERRNLSPAQRAEAMKAMKAVAAELKKEGKTQAEVGRHLGVRQQQVSEWLGSITGTGKASKPARNGGKKAGKPPKPARHDSRVKVSAEAKPDIADRINGGENREQVGADYGITGRQAARTVVTEIIIIVVVFSSCRCHALTPTG